MLGVPPHFGLFHFSNTSPTRVPPLASLSHDHGLSSDFWLFSITPPFPLSITSTLFSMNSNPTHNTKLHLSALFSRNILPAKLRHPGLHHQAHGYILFCSLFLKVSWSCFSRIPWASQKTRAPTFTILGTFKALDKYLMEPTSRGADTSHNMSKVNVLKEPSPLANPIVLQLSTKHQNPDLI